MMTENVNTANNHLSNHGTPKRYIFRRIFFLYILHFSSFLKTSDGKIITTMDDLAGWKSKLKVPPKDNRIKTSVNNATC